MQHFEMEANTMTNDHAPLVVMSRCDPDLDGVACAFAYAELLSHNGLKCRPWYPGKPDGEAAFALQSFPDACDGLQPPSVVLANYVLVDSSDLNGIPASIRPDWIIEVIDHRFYTNPKQLFPKAKLEIEPVGAAATLIAEKFIRSFTPMSQASACLLYGAVHSNTLKLKGDLTTGRDVAAVGWLEKTGLILPDLLRRQFEHRKMKFFQILANFFSGNARDTIVQIWVSSKWHNLNS
jgi:manganese-dependent inorganic pyrophosphatase